MLPEPTEQTAATAAATPEEEGKALIAGSDCLTCHKEDAKLVGPSYQEVAAKYTEADIDMLADKIINGGSGVWGEIPMSAHAGMDKENAKNGEIYSHQKINNCTNCDFNRRQLFWVVFF